MTRQSTFKTPPKEHFKNNRHPIVLIKLGLRKTKRVGWEDGILSLQLLQILHEREEEATTAITESADRFRV